MKLNNNGQTLVLFILLMPILLMLVALVIEIGLISVEKRKTDNIVKDVIEYGLKNKDKEDVESKMNQLINSNIDNINYIDINMGEEVVIEGQVTFSNIFGNLFKKRINNYNFKYKGYLENEKIKIVRG